MVLFFHTFTVTILKISLQDYCRVVQGIIDMEKTSLHAQNHKLYLYATEVPFCYIPKTLITI